MGALVGCGGAAVGVASGAHAASKPPTPPNADKRNIWRRVNWLVIFILLTHVTQTSANHANFR
jgi:hypothetical protein